jgi:hypothetical protein
MKNKKNKSECDVHGAPHKGANRTLLAMMGAEGSEPNLTGHDGSRLTPDGVAGMG